MSNGIKCVLCALGGGLVASLVLYPVRLPHNLSNQALAQQEKPAAGKASGGILQAGQNVKVDDEHVVAKYSNFVRLTATPEEVICDFGVNPQPFAGGEQQVRVSERVILNFYTAKRFLIALQTTLDKHESTFGPIELDVRKRARTHEENGGRP